MGVIRAGLPGRSGACADEPEDLDDPLDAVEAPGDELDAGEAAERRVACGVVGLLATDVLAEDADIPPHAVDARGLSRGEDEGPDADRGLVVADRHGRVGQREAESANFSSIVMHASSR